MRGATPELMSLLEKHVDRWTAAAVAAAAIILETAAVAAPPSTAGLPSEVRSYVQDLNERCRRAGGTPSESPRLVRSVDLTGDRRLDYVVDDGGYVCVNAISIMSAGHNGAAVSIFVGVQGGGAIRAYDGYSHGVTIASHHGRPRATLIVGALNCGQPSDPARPFSEWWFCSRPLEWDARNKRFAFAPLIQTERIDRRAN